MPLEKIIIPKIKAFSHQHPLGYAVIFLLPWPTDYFCVANLKSSGDICDLSYK
jgi:hypothetical protein